MAKNVKEEKAQEEEVVRQEEYLDDANIEIATNLNISENVVGIIAGLAAAEVEGLAGMSLSFTDGINQIFGSNKKYAKGVRIELDGKKVKVDLYVNVKYGVRIPDVAWSAQNAVKKAVENMTGLEVEAVNVNVQGIILDETKKAKADEEEE